MTSALSTTRESSAVRFFRWIAPIFVAIGLVFFASQRADTGTAPLNQESEGAERQGGRVVVVIVDSLDPKNIDNADVPWMSSMVQSGEVVRADLGTCKANFTLPCVQTLFDGKESPFVAGLHNFTGKKGSDSSFPPMLASMGVEVVLISNHTLNSLYGASATRAFDSQEWKVDYRERDLLTLERATEELSRPTTQFLVSHGVGTDKVAHHEKPGSTAYAEHFADVDAAVSKLAEKLDPARDFLIITGDHGHDKDGHHTLTSVALFWGEGYRALFKGIGGPPSDLAQSDLRFFLSYPYALPIPIEADVRFFEWTKGTPSPRYQRMLKAQSRILGEPETTIIASLNEERDKRDSQRGNAVWELLPVLLVGGLFVAWSFEVNTGRTQSRLASMAAFALAAASLVWASTPELGPMLALGALGLWGWTALKKGTLGIGFTVLALLAATALASVYAREWADFFHTRGGFRWPWLVFYGAMFPSGLAIARGIFGELKFAPESSMVAAVIALPSGVYYYQAGQNFWSFFLVAGAFTVVWSLFERRRSGERLIPSWKAPTWFAATVLVAALIFSMLQEAGGWEWKFFPTVWMRWQWSGFGPICLLAGVSLGAGLLNSHVQRLAYIVTWGLLTTFAVVVGELEFVRVASISVLVLIPLAYAKTLYSEPNQELRSLPKYRPHLKAAGLGIAIWISATHSTWVLLDGFILTHVDFSFALDAFGNISTESLVYVLVQAAANLKYGFHIILVCLGVRLIAGARAFDRAFSYAMVLAFFELLSLIVQASFGQSFQEERLWELAVSDLLFVTNIAVSLPFVWLGLTVLSRLGIIGPGDEAVEFDNAQGNR